MALSQPMFKCDSKNTPKQRNFQKFMGEMITLYHQLPACTMKEQQAYMFCQEKSLTGLSILVGKYCSTNLESISLQRETNPVRLPLDFPSSLSNDA